MSIQMNSHLPAPEALKAELPLSSELQALKRRRDGQIRAVFTGESDKFIVIVGPCSADNEDSVCDYVSRLARVGEALSDRLILIPRIYTRAMRESGLTAADEMLYPENRSYLDDLLSYEAVGARSVEDQQHRLVASGMDIPVGMKNPTSGDFSVMLNSVQAAQSAHRFLYRGYDVSTDGNELAHVILRGGVDKYGTCIPNYHYEDLLRLLEMYGMRGLKNPAAIVDANHSNSDKKYKEQIRIVGEVMYSRRYNADLKKLVKGVMIESYIEEGCQPISAERVYGKSITDPCLGWEDTEKLLFKIAEEC